MINFKKEYFVGISLALVLLVLDVLFLRSTRWFIAIIIVSINIGWLQFWIDFFREQNRQKEIDTKFLEFVRNLVSTAKSGLSIPRAIIQATPSAGLWDNQTDEKEFGFTYREADQILHLYIDRKIKVEKIIKLGFKNGKKVVDFLEKNQFKQQTPYRI